MAIALKNLDRLAAKQDAGTDVTYEINGDDRTVSGSVDSYCCLAQGALSTTATALVDPASGHDAIVDSISIVNTGASTRVVTFYKTLNSTTYTSATQWGPAITLPTLWSAQWTGRGWQVYDSNGFPVQSSGGQVGSAGGIVSNSSVAGDSSGFAADTYLTGSSIAMPAGYPLVKTQIKWQIAATKTANGVATPIIQIRYGTNGSTADTSRVTLTFAANTAAADEGYIEITAVFSTVGSGSAAVIQAMGTLHHRLASTGMANVNHSVQTASSAGFDSTPANSKIGLSLNAGASAAWTVQQVSAVMGL